MVRELSQALDDFGERPLIVRSSTLLEDSFDAAFSGKYKSLFLANQGDKAERLEGLLDAIAEVYASLFSPDPIEYRTERGLLDYQEEMGVLIQEVIGTRVGKYLFPACAGVAFSNNEFRWSPRIAREDGLVRLVPGLGTRAVDRVGDDYPVLIAPNKPMLRVNPQPEEALRYAPKWMDVINLDSNAFETVKVETLLAELGSSFPRARQLFSCYTDGLMSRPNALCEFDQGEYAVTFEGLLAESGVIAQIRAILQVLQAHYRRPMDIEFAIDESHFYLLQCRPQSFERSNTRVVLPTGVADGDILFSANRYVSDGLLLGLTHIVYVSAEEYDALESREELLAVGTAVSLLNSALPKRRFVLMGPGRWGSRGDIKLGVNVNYSDINNCAALIEMACRKGNYLPDLSFGTHFFQDLVEASIRYLPLYPDDPEVLFARRVFEEAPNLLRQILPAFAHLSKVLRVIEVGQVRKGCVLNLVMSGDENRALAYFAPRPNTADEQTDPFAKLIAPIPGAAASTRDAPWIWRMRLAEQFAQTIDAPRFGLCALYLTGSTANSSAEAESDIDLIAQLDEAMAPTDPRLMGLLTFVEGYNASLCEAHYLRSGIRIEQLVHLHLITSEQAQRRTGIAVKIDAVSDPAKLLPIRRA